MVREICTHWFSVLLCWCILVPKQKVNIPICFALSKNGNWNEMKPVILFIGLFYLEILSVRPVFPSVSWQFFSWNRSVKLLVFGCRSPHTARVPVPSALWGGVDLTRHGTMSSDAASDTGPVRWCRSNPAWYNVFRCSIWHRGSLCQVPCEVM